MQSNPADQIQLQSFPNNQTRVIGKQPQATQRTAHTSAQIYSHKILNTYVETHPSPITKSRQLLQPTLQSQPYHSELGRAYIKPRRLRRV